MTRTISAATDAAADIEIPAAPRLGRSGLLAGLAGVIFLVGLVAWSNVAPIASAVVAGGEVRAEGNRRTVQHLEGGIVREIAVREGDRVRAGGVLLRLDDVQSAANEDAIRQQLDALRAQEARLQAEADGADDVVVPPGLYARQADPRIAQMIAGQRRIFQTRKRAQEGQVVILRQRIGQLRAQIAAHEAQVNAYDRQLRLVAEEIAAVRQLVDKGLERRPRLLALERAAAQASGARDEQRGLIEKARQGIGEAELQILQTDATFQASVTAELRETQANILAQEERLKAARDVQQRRDVVAPVDGTVVGLRFHTVGGVVRAGETILEIAPSREDLVIDMHVSPADIDALAEGQRAEIRFATLKARVTPTLHGRVEIVSADSLKDERSGRSFYRAVVRIASGEVARLGDQPIRPGMPVEILVPGVERTLVQYLWAPVRDSLNRAFREQ